MAFYATEIRFDQMIRNCLADLIIATETIKDIDDNGVRLLCRDLNTTSAQFQFRRNFDRSVPGRCSQQIIINAVTLPWDILYGRNKSNSLPGAKITLGQGIVLCQFISRSAGGNAPAFEDV